MSHDLLQMHLGRVGRRRTLLDARLWLTRWALGIALVAAVLLVLQLFDLFYPPLVVALAALFVFAIARAIVRSSRPLDPHAIARRIEADYPEARGLILAALEQQPDPDTDHLSYLQQRVIEQAVEHAEHNAWPAIVSDRHLRRAGGMALFTALLAAACIAMLLRPGVAPVRSAAHPQAAAPKAHVTVTPGDTSVERGASLVVLARFDGPAPSSASLLIGQNAGSLRRIPLSRNLDDPVFGGVAPAIHTDAVYRIEYADQATRDFAVTVYDHPAMQRADASIDYPDYTKLPRKLIEDTRHVSAVEGSKLRMSFRLNKPVATAELRSTDNEPLALLPDPADPTLYAADVPMHASHRYELHLVDHEGRANKLPDRISVDVLKNLPPDIKLVFPRRDLRVSPLEELALQAEAWDDFGLQRYGVSYAVIGSPARNLMLGETTLAGLKQPMQLLLAMEELRAQPDQLVTYHFWAEDVAADGKPRRTASDMYFAEVRHFEEIFREGVSPPGQEPGGKQTPTDELLELQKQVVGATWKIQRTTGGSADAAHADKDLAVVRDAQQHVVGQAEAALEKMRNPDLKTTLQQAIAFMQQAAGELTKAVEGRTAQPLTDALQAEQAAYQALLKLRAREHQIARSQSRKGGGGQQRSTQQLNELELKHEDRRYETQSQAEDPQISQEQRENLQVLSRLKELAQRQQDLNDKLKELQAQLQEATTPQQREEIRRQLERLRQEQREVLRDIDELRQRMDQPENKPRMADSNRQLEATREQARAAAEAMERGELSGAVGSATRAQRDLQQLRDDFRKRTAGRFEEQVRRLRQDARELAENQQKIAEELRQAGDARRRNLDSEGTGEKAAARLDEQHKRLGQVMRQMKELSEQSETAEPLLHNRLYEPYRKATVDRVDNMLQVGAELARHNVVREAQEAERRARQGIDDLTRGVERAAEAVLGDEAAGLRLARAQVESLARQLAQEIEQQTGRKPGDAPGRELSRETAHAPEASRGQPGQREAKGEGKAAGRQSEAAVSREPVGKTGGHGKRQSNGDATRPAGEPAAHGERGSPESGKGQGQGQNNDGDGGRDQAQKRQPTRGRFFDQAGGNGPGAVITGEGFRQWSDELREVEELVADPRLREDVANVREAARNARAEFTRHSKAPEWNLVETQVFRPLVELRVKISEELARKAGEQHKLSPIDRDPVPGRYADLVRRYYETLGGGK